MRVLITGASGVIGLNLISEFIEAYGTNYQIFAQHTREIPPKILLEIDPNSQVIHVKNIWYCVWNVIYLTYWDGIS